MFDKTLESLINNSMNQSPNANITFATSFNDPKSEIIGEKARLLDQAASEGLGIAAKLSIRDGSFNNPAMGTGSSNYMLNSAYFMHNMITFDRSQLTAIYHGCWVLRRIVDRTSRDMWSRGVEISGNNDPDQLKLVYSRFRKVKRDLIYATQQAKLYGGSAALMMVDDGETDLSRPLNLRNIKPGSKITFLVTDRWFGLEWSNELVDDYRDYDFGTPKYYSFFIDGQEELSGQKIHHSRVLRFVNRRSPKIIEQQLQGWGTSELEHVLQDLMNHENTKNSIASLLNKALLEIVKLDGMRNTMSGLSAGNPQASQMFAAQMTALNNYRTSNKLVFMDKQDDYEQVQYAFSGLSDILNSQKDIVSGAAEMPEVLLFGTNRAGLNGESPVELRIYADKILGDQEEMLPGIIEKVLRVIFRCCGLEIPKDLDYDFIGIIDTDPSSKQSELQTIVNTSISLVDAGLIRRKTALAEIQAAQKTTGYGTKFEDEDFELAEETDKAEKEAPQGAEFGLGGMDELDLEQASGGDVDSEEGLEDTQTIKTPQDDYEIAKEKIIQATIRDKKRFKRK